MSSLDDIRAARLAKIKLLQGNGINPYPVSCGATHSIAAVSEQFEKLLENKTPILLAGRVLAMRGQGGLVFCDLYDGTGRFQALLKRDETNESGFALWGETVDIGDFVEVAGSLFVTKKSEKTLQVKEWRMLAKSLRPLPEKWHGLQDVEERFRKRYLDILMNEEVRARFILRSRVVSALRGFLDRDGFLEVETSLLQPLSGGANAEPFKTHHNALNIDLYLRIAPELDLKKLLIGGLPKVYEIGRSLRNEGIDVTHNPEFTTVEWYEAYSDAAKQRAFVEKIMRGIVAEVTGGTVISFSGSDIDIGKPFATVEYFDALKRYALIPNPEKAARDELSLKAVQLDVKINVSDSVEKILDSIYKKAVRPKIIQPTFIVGYPKNYIPLAKSMEDTPAFVDAFQVVIGGMEIVKAFSELNDPIEQAERFAVEEAHWKEGDAEAQQNDHEFIEALEYGMPPAGGVGMGIERLVMLLANVKNIREVILFPTLRPKQN